jgi:hypothetical protein
VLTERLQTVAEDVPAIDAVPLREAFRGLRAGGLFESCTRTVQSDLAENAVEYKDSG